MNGDSLLTQIRQLPVNEQIELLRYVWDSLVESGQSTELTPQQQRDLDHRLREHHESPNDVVSWAQSRREIETK